MRKLVYIIFMHVSTEVIINIAVHVLSRENYSEADPGGGGGLQEYTPTPGMHSFYNCQWQ